MKVITSMSSSALGAILLLSSSAVAHPGLTTAQQGEPCPFLAQKQYDETNRRLGHGYLEGPTRSLASRTGDGGIPEGGFAAVQADLKALYTVSQDVWPADFLAEGTPHYGGLFIRLAWHCAGSYRESDGRGGCDGGRIRHDPEINWPDNGNLDKALLLLEPIKEKYGESLSWGDLIILSGTTAIEAMGGPSLGFCGGRIDDADGANSLKLGPSPEQEEIGPCQSFNPSMQGTCLQVENSALGPTTVGLIYVNPGGPVDAPGDPVASGADIRKAFANMGFDDVESVALIGGGHAFGKCHGACDSPPCGDGKGVNTFTAGFEGAWTTTPTVWTNQYFNNLFDFTWANITGPGGELQWAPSTEDGEAGPDVIMLTSDIALSVDEQYKPLSEGYAADISSLETDFAAAWYRLTSADMGPADRCIGDLVPEAQPFQNTLSEAPATLPDYVAARSAIQELLDGDETNADAFINLAYRCASTFRETDYRGGCNGARIRFEPEKTWETNAGTTDALATLESVKASNGDVSYADLIVLAGVTALEHENADMSLVFCGGGVDAEDGSASAPLAPRVYSTPLITISDDMLVKGLTAAQAVALASRESVGTEYYTNLLDRGAVYSEEELAMLDNAEMLAHVESFAADKSALMASFSEAWSKLMTADRYGEFNMNACTGVSSVTKEGAEGMTASPVAVSDTTTTNAPAASPSEPSSRAATVATMPAVALVGAVASLFM